MSFSTEIEQATRSAWAAMLQAQQIQNETLIQRALSSQPRMDHFSCGCDDDTDEPASSSDWLSSFMQSNSMMMWASMIMSAAMDQLMSVVGRLTQAGRSSSSTSREPAAASTQGSRPQGGRAWPSSPGPGWSGFHWPLENYPITSAFGPRRDPVGHRKCRFHHGVDIGAPWGTPIRAAAAGRVVAAGWVEGYGNYIRIDHGNGRETAYGHCSWLGVQVGQRVERGKVIGNVGNTGHSTGPHLHFEVIRNGRRENPCNHVHP
jgi:hypothetical protein